MLKKRQVAFPEVAQIKGCGKIYNMKLVVYFLLSWIMLSCSKSPETLPAATSASGLIQYKINGELIRIDNANLSNGEKVVFVKQLQGMALPASRYILNAQKKPDHFLTITIVTDTLDEVSYHYDSSSVNNNFTEFTFDLDDNGKFISLFFSTDNLNINISSYKNSRITGTFTARFSEVTGSFSDYNTRGSIFITEGVLNNVPVTF